MKVASRASPRRQVAKELPWWRWWRTALRDAQTLEKDQEECLVLEDLDIQLIVKLIAISMSLVLSQWHMQVKTLEEVNFLLFINRSHI